MKYCLLSFFLLVCCAFWSQGGKIYFDQNWKKCSGHNATYYRLVTKEKQGKSKLYIVNDYFMDGSLQMSGSYSDKKLEVRNGAFEYFYSNGTLKQKSFYVNDSLHDLDLRYMESGQLEIEDNYFHGDLHGTSKRYYEDGSLAAEGTLIYGKSEGAFITYYKNGSKCDEEIFRNGNREGESRYYFKNGNLASVETYVADSLVSYKLFNESGIVAPQTDLLNRPAEFAGGKTEMKRYLSDNLEYPESALRYAKEGKCYVNFVITGEGKIKDVKVEQGVHDCPECDEEAMRVIREMPAWIPAIDHHRPVNSYFKLPVTFKLGGGRKKLK